MNLKVKRDRSILKQNGGGIAITKTMNINVYRTTTTSSSYTFITNFSSQSLSQNPNSQIKSSSLSVSTPNKYSKTIATFSRNQLKPMSSSSSTENVKSYSDEFSPIQLNDVEDFHKIASDDGYISICGFGAKCMEYISDLINFRVARLKGFRRVFAHVAPIFFERGIAKPETKEISSLSVEPCEGEELIVTVFEIQKSEVPSFMKRELEFRFLAVMLETWEGNPFSIPAVLCARYSDEEFFNIRCKGSKEIYDGHYGRYNIDKIWRDDILPCRLYLRHCVLAAKNLGDVACNNFLDHTYLGDRETTIRQYLATTGSGVMEEEPPESLKSRYGG